MEYWGNHPPAHIVLAAAHLKPRQRSKNTYKADAAEDIAQYGMALGWSGTLPPLPAIYRDK
jgi:hypothetical protein